MPDLYDRVRADIKTQENALWAGLSSAHPGEAILPLLASDCVLHFPNCPPLSSDTKPTLEERVLDPKAFKRWTRYDVTEMRVTPVGLMAAFEAKITKLYINQIKSGVQFDLIWIAKSWI
ncbi:hypothetical protein HRG_014281 [Hirsutella rhossiliensis]